jgi:hypothetical protein
MRGCGAWVLAPAAWGGSAPPSVPCSAFALLRDLGAPRPVTHSIPERRVDAEPGRDKYPGVSRTRFASKLAPTGVQSSASWAIRQTDGSHAPAWEPALGAPRPATRSITKRHALADAEPGRDKNPGVSRTCFASKLAPTGVQGAAWCAIRQADCRLADDGSHAPAWGPTLGAPRPAKRSITNRHPHPEPGRAKGL